MNALEKEVAKATKVRSKKGKKGGMSAAGSKRDEVCGIGDVDLSLAPTWAYRLHRKSFSYGAMTQRRCAEPRRTSLPCCALFCTGSTSSSTAAKLGNGLKLRKSMRRCVSLRSSIFFAGSYRLL